MKRTKMNSTQIAQLAGVSRSTVSRVINNYPSVPPETRERVMKVIKEYNYFPDMSAQVLAGKNMRTIGLFIIDKGSVSSDPTSNLLISSVIEAASAHDYYVLTNIIRDNRSPKSIERVKEVFYQNRINAGIFMGTDNHEPFIEELIAEGFIIGIVDQDLPGRDEPNRIVYSFDNKNGAVKAIDYLVSLNHRKIGIINGDLKRHAGSARYEGFLNSMKSHGLPIRKEWVLQSDFSRIDGYNTMNNFLKTKVDLPTAFFAGNDSIAFGAIQALNEKNINVPSDISIIGIDDHVLSSLFNPPLTTFKADFSYMMQSLTNDLIKTIEHPNYRAIKLTMGSELIVRESCLPI
ncbi:LacI family DNA-binding transcriptional regulator [Neobacillus niacini]|jgi:LacI family transcriptional regulator|uniref:LacI family DNA-binding transcriptional regulator n=1 Tax=Neobacillus niacini TaxID=86668 RepID=UPI001C8DEB9F|nr:LacI family DNA-binding transcriptional regulator [Neobacillus niacini]MBY0146058.1 LacI family DNA-binding transcriptional regulator [Neobacillus niacini]